MSTIFKKIATYLLEGVTTMNEYWIIALLHEIGRHTVFYGSNVNSPQVGYFVTLLFVMFYVGRLVGELLAIAFVNGRKFVLVTYIMAIPMLVAMYALGWRNGAFWIMVCRAAIGFLSSFAPALCILRTEVNKTHLIKKIIEEKDKGNGRVSTKEVAVPGVHRYLQAIIHFIFQYGSMLFASALYSWEDQNIKRPVFWITIISAGVLLIFIVAFKCYEPQRVDQIPIVKKYFEEERNKPDNLKTHWETYGKGGFFELLFADDDLMWDTIAARVYEAARMLDLVFMSLMVQTNPYYKGLFFSRKYVILVIFVAALISLPCSIFFAKIVSAKNARKSMIIVFWISFFFYPLAATCVNIFNYKSPKWGYVFYCGTELIKFLLAYIIREAHRELVSATHNRKTESFKAAGSLFENLFKAIVFLFGYWITWSMSSNRVQKMNPYNYAIGFLAVIPCFLAAYFANIAARVVDDDKDKNK